MEMVLSIEDGGLQALQPQRFGQKWQNAGRSGTTTTTHLDWPTTSENPHAHAQTNVP
jgi:hypothetical protein